MPRSEAQKRADKRYKEKYKPNISNIGVTVLKPERAVYDTYARSYGIAVSQLMRRCTLYCIRHGVDISGMDTSIDGLTDTPTDTPIDE